MRGALLVVWALATAGSLFAGQPGAVAIEPKILRGHSGAVKAIAFSSQGDMLASGGDDSVIQVWRVPGGATLNSKPLKGHPSGVRWLAFDPSGRFLYSAGRESRIRIWSVGSWAQGKSPFEHASVISAAALDERGDLIASASAPGPILLWSADGRTSQGEVQTPGGAYSLAFSRDSTLLASGSEVRTGRADESSVDEESSALDNRIRIWRITDQREDRSLVGHSEKINSVAFSPDGQSLASASSDATVRLWKMSAGKVTILKGHSAPVDSVAFSPNGKILASGGWDGPIHLWHAVTGEPLCVLSGHSGAVHAVAFSPDGTFLAAGGADSTVRLWRLDEGLKSFMVAVNLQRGGKLREAQAAFEESIAAYPCSGNVAGAKGQIARIETYYASYEEGVAALAAGEFGRAKLELEQANKLFPRNEVRVALERVRGGLAQQARQKSLNVQQQHFERAQQFLAAKDLAEAKRELEVGLRLADNASARETLRIVVDDIRKFQALPGQAEQALSEGRFEDSEKALESALAIMDNAELRARLGEVQVKLKEKAEAERLEAEQRAREADVAEEERVKNEAKVRREDGVKRTSKAAAAIWLAGAIPLIIWLRKKKGGYWASRPGIACGLGIILLPAVLLFFRGLYLTQSVIVWWRGANAAPVSAISTIESGTKPGR